MSIVEPNEQNALVPRPAYVEDAPDQEAPPRVPSPPPAVPADINVFDFLVTDESPRSSRTSINAAKRHSAPPVASKAMAEGKENVNQTYHNSEETIHTKEYELQGFSYGAEPVNPRPYRNDNNNSQLSLEFMTPAAKETRAKLDKKTRPVSLSHSRSNSGSISVGKRKRANTEDQANGSLRDIDTPMPDVADDPSRPPVDTPLALVHSGLTGGLTRLMPRSGEDYPFPPSPHDDTDRGHDRRSQPRQHSGHDDPASPLKRSRRSKEDLPNGLGISIKGRAGKVMSIVGAAFTNPASAHNEGVNNRDSKRRGSSSDQGQSQTRSRDGDLRDRDGRKKHRVHRYNGTSSSNVRYERSNRGSRSHGHGNGSPEAQRRKLKVIEYHRSSPEDSDTESEEYRSRGANGQMVIFGAAQQAKQRCESFLSFVTKGPESERGCSINKALKRWHRESETRSSHSTRTSHIKMDEEKELWRHLRLKRNDRGEIVVFF